MNTKQQQIAAYVFGVVFVATMLAIALFVPNPSSFQYLVFRIVLSVAVAGVAAMIPGFIEVNIPGVLRAGGALAVFAVVFFYNPAALVSHPPPDGIEPLQPPIQDRTPKSFLRAPPDGVENVKYLVKPEEQANRALSDGGGLSVAQLLEGHSKDAASRLFDLTLSNASDSQMLITRLEARWRYQHGFLASVDHGAALTPIAKYVIDFPIDTDDEHWRTFSQVMSPSIALAPGTSKNPTLVTTRIQLHYHFAGRLNYHPSGDWDILFDVVAVSPTGQRVAIFKDARWRAN